MDISDDEQENGENMDEAAINGDDDAAAAANSDDDPQSRWRYGIDADEMQQKNAADKEEDDGMVLVLCVGFCAKISLHLVVITVNLQRRLCL